MSLKVLFLIDTLAVGGAERSLLDITRRFTRIQPVTAHLYPAKDLKPSFEGAGIPVISLDIDQEYGLMEGTRRFKSVVERENPDLIHATLFRSEVVARLVAAWTGVPLVGSFVNDSYAASRWEGLSAVQKVKLGLVQVIDACTARLCPHFIAISEAIKRANAGALRLPEERIHVIHRGRDPADFTNVPDEQVDAARKALEVPVDCRIVLNVARLIHRKGQEELIEGFVKVVNEYPNAHLLIAGEGHHRPVLEELTDYLGIGDHVHLLGTRDDVPALLQLADVFVFPSHYEGHGGALVEAMFAGCPIVASDTAVHRESVTDGETARLVPLKDPDGLAENIQWMLGHPEKAHQYGHRAQQTAMERFHIDQIAEQHEAFYQDVLEKEV